MLTDGIYLSYPGGQLAAPGEPSLAILPCSNRWDREVGVGGAAASPVSRTLFRVVNGWSPNSAHTRGILMCDLWFFQTVLTKVLANPYFSHWPLSKSTVERRRAGLNAQILAWLFLQSSSWGASFVSFLLYTCFLDTGSFRVFQNSMSWCTDTHMKLN